MKKMVLIILAVSMIATLGLAPAQAGWYQANVKMTGQGGVTPVVMLTDLGGAFTNRWFVLTAAYANAQLATALTSLSTGIRVYVNFTAAGVPPEYSVVTALYLDNR